MAFSFSPAYRSQHLLASEEHIDSDAFLRTLDGLGNGHYDWKDERSKTHAHRSCLE